MEAVVATLDAARGRRPSGRRLSLATGALVLLVLAGWRGARALHRPAVAHGPDESAGAAYVPAVPPHDEPPHIVLLLDAAEGLSQVNGSVSAWIDQSGSGNDAVAGSTPPTRIASAVHGHPAVHFEGGSWMSVADSPSLRFGTGDFTVEVVARHNRVLSTAVTGYGRTIGYGMLYGKSEIPEPFAGVCLFVNVPQPVPSTKFGVQTSYYHYVVSTSDGLNDGKPHLFGARRVGTTLEVRLDGVAQGRLADAGDDVSATGRPAFLGGHPEDRGTIQQLKGDIAEIVVIQDGMTPRVLATLEGELLAKFGLR
jgi:hypothetical protein